MTCAAATICALLDVSGTTITLGPTDHPQAVAEVIIRNAMTNGPWDTREYTMTHDGLTIGLAFVWEAGPFGADQITVTPPDGFICDPLDCTATVDELFSGVVYILPFQGM